MISGFGRKSNNEGEGGLNEAKKGRDGDLSVSLKFSSPKISLKEESSTGSWGLIWFHVAKDSRRLGFSGNGLSKFCRRLSQEAIAESRKLK